MIDIRARLPKEEAALLISAIDTAKDQFGPPPPKPDPCGDAHKTTPGVTYSNADALLDVARVFLNTAPEDRSGEDRTRVVVHVSAENLGDVPAGTSNTSEAVCHIEGVGSIEPATAQKHACDAPLLARWSIRRRRVGDGPHTTAGHQDAAPCPDDPRWHVPLSGLPPNPTPESPPRNRGSSAAAPT